MKNFFWISRLYFKRSFLAPANLLMIGLPIIFMVAFYLVDLFLAGQVTYYGLEDSGRMSFMHVVIPMILGFQFFGTDGVAESLHNDLKGPTGARLKVSGNDNRVFYLAVITASWMFYLLTGLFLIPIAYFVFGVPFASIPLTILALALLALMAQVIGVIPTCENICTHLSDPL